MNLDIPVELMKYVLISSETKQKLKKKKKSKVYDQNHIDVGHAVLL